MEACSPKNILFIQPQLAHYRIPFFNAMAEDELLDICVWYSPTGSRKTVEQVEKLSWARPVGDMVRLPFNLLWQKGVLSIPLKDKDLIVISANPRRITTMLIFLKAKFLRKKVIWWGHYWSATSKSWRAKLRLFLAGFADGIMFYTKKEGEKYREIKTGQKIPYVLGLNNGLDDAPILNRRLEFVPETRKVEIVFIGRLTEKASLIVLLDALSILKRSGIKLNIIGGGDVWHKYEQYADCLGLRENVVWHGPSLSEDYIASVANRCRIFVYPGDVGLSIVHAMTYGLPCIVHSEKSCHMPEIACFEDKLTGLVFERGNPRSLASKIEELVLDDRRLKAMSDRCILTVNNNYTTRAMARRCKRLIFSVTNA